MTQTLEAPNATPDAATMRARLDAMPGLIDGAIRRGDVAGLDQLRSEREELAASVPLLEARHNAGTVDELRHQIAEAEAELKQSAEYREDAAIAWRTARQKLEDTTRELTLALKDARSALTKAQLNESNCKRQLQEMQTRLHQQIG